MKNYFILGGKLGLITLLTALLLSGTYALTKDRIAAYQNEATEKAVEAVLPVPGKEILSVEVLDISGETDIPQCETRLVTAKDGAKYYAIVAEPTGYGGKISMMVGVASDLTVTGISIISMSETPGLGTKAAEPTFAAQFAGKTTGVKVTKGTPKDNEIAAITGATISSEAITSGVRTALEIAEKLTSK